MISFLLGRHKHLKAPKKELFLNNSVEAKSYLKIRLLKCAGGWGTKFEIWSKTYQNEKVRKISIFVHFKEHVRTSNFSFWSTISPIFISNLAIRIWLEKRAHIFEILWSPLAQKCTEKQPLYLLSLSSPVASPLHM